MEAVGKTVFYLALAAGIVAAVAYLSGLVWMFAVVIHHRSAGRPTWVNYAALVFGLALLTMLVGLVLWGRLDWWFLILFAPFVASRSILFWMSR